MTTPVWREALTDTKHELHRAAWLIFAPGVSVKTTQEHLADKQDVVIPFLSEIVDDDDLYDKEAIGTGKAPVVAMYLMGEWKVRSALPSLLEVLEVSADNDEVHEAAVTAISNLGEEALDDFIAWANDNDGMSTEAAQILVKLAPANEKAFDWIANWVKTADDEIEFYTDRLIDLNAAQAETFLDEASQDGELSKDNQKLLRKKAREASKRVKENLEKQLAATKAQEAARIEAEIAESDAE